MTLSSPRWAHGTFAALCVLACTLTLPSTAAAAHRRHHTGAATHRHGHRSGHSRPRHHRGLHTRSHHHLALHNRARRGRSGAGVPRELAAASRSAVLADRQLVLDARSLRACFTAHGAGSASCSAGRAALQRAGIRFAEAEQHLALVAGRGGTLVSAARLHHRARHNPRTPPALAVSGYELRWSRVAHVADYVLMRQVPGQPAQYMLLPSLSFTPPPVSGATVSYRVRSGVRNSAWSVSRTITYPAPTAGAPTTAAPTAGTTSKLQTTTSGGQHKQHSGEPTGGGGGGGGGTGQPDPQAAPTIVVSGYTLSWNQVAAITTYVLVTKIPGQQARYSEVTGTSVTPPAVPGTTVRYSVRTAVEGSAWSPEVSITYPASAPVPTPTPTEGGGGSSSTSVALDIGGWSWASAVNDAAGAVKYFRSDYKHFNSDSQMELLARDGVTLMPLFGEGGTLAEYDTPAFVAEIVSWFKRYGKGGSFWAGRPVDLGATTAELINEPGNPYFYPDYSNYQLYANLTKAVHGALEANFAPSVRPKLLVSYDGGYAGSSYGRTIFADGAVADGVTVHPYGGHGSTSALGNHERVTQAHSETGLPVYVTEIGWPTAVGLPPTGDSLQWTEQQQAENITNFIGWARGLGYVADVTYFNYADYGTNDWYGIVNATGTVHKLGYAALKAAAAAG